MSNEKLAAPATELTKTKHLPKKIVALTHFLSRPLIQPEADEAYGDISLDSTVLTLYHMHGIAFNRVFEDYGKYGAKFIRYTLLPDHREQAFKLVEYYKKKSAESQPA